MADNDQSPEELKILEELLSSAAPHLLHIPSDLADDLLRKGAVLALRENAGPTAVGTLAKLAATSPSVDTRNSALSALSLLAASGVVSAVDEMYNLGLEDHQAAARQMVSTAKWKPSNPGIKTLFDWLTAVDNQQDPAVNLEMLTEGFFGAAGPSLQARILSRAAATRLRNWAQMVALLIRAPQDLQGLVDLYPDLSQSEQSICLDRLDKLAAHETAAQVVLCRLFLEHDDRTARDIATAKGYRPTQPFEQALFYFLIGDQQRYQQVDFDHNLLVTAYEAGSRALRRRLLSFSRQTGQIEWLSAIHQTTEVRWLADLSDQDWDLAVHSLLEQSRFADLWRLAQVAPPVWSAGILVRLKRAQWKPDNERDRDGFHQLVNLAETCLQETLGLKPFLKLMSLSDEVLSLAIHPTGSLIAAGSSAQPILLWQLPGGDLRLPSLIGPASSTRAIQFSLDGELVIAASGDQRVRLFRHQNNQIIKTLEGHHGLIRAIALHPNGRMLITTSFDGAIRLWRFPLGTLIKTVFSPVREIFSAVTLSKGDLLATGGAGDQVTLWNLPDCNRLRSIPVDENGILHLAATASSDLLAVADRSRVITIWNAINGNLVHQLPPQDDAIAGLHFHPNEQILVSISSGGSIKLWNMNSGSPLFSFSTPHARFITTCLSPDGQLLACADGSGAIYLWNLSSLIWLHTAYQPGAALPIEDILKRLADPTITPAEKNWLHFTDALWKWIRRFEIEISEPLMIELGEFDIEL